VAFSLNLLGTLMLDVGALYGLAYPGAGADGWATPGGITLAKICWTPPMFEPQDRPSAFRLAPVSTFPRNWVRGVAFSALSGSRARPHGPSGALNLVGETPAGCKRACAKFSDAGRPAWLAAHPPDRQTLDTLGTGVEKSLPRLVRSTPPVRG